MTELNSDLYQFNGLCDLSHDADFTLLFDNGSVLKTHSLILRKASPVLASFIKSAHEEVLTIEGCDYFTWLVILNHLYPGISQSEESILVHDLVVEEVLREAYRYELSAIVSQVDRELMKKFKETKLKIETHLSAIADTFKWVRPLKKSMTVAARFQLPNAITAANKCLAAFLTGAINHDTMLDSQKGGVEGKLEYKNSVLRLGSEYIDFSELIQVGFADVLFRFHSILLTLEP